MIEEKDKVIEEKEQVIAKKEKVIEEKEKVIEEKEKVIVELQKNQRVEMKSSEYHTNKHMINFTMRPSDANQKDVKDFLVDAKVSSHQMLIEILKNFERDPEEEYVECAKKMMKIRTEVIFKNQVKKKEHESYYSSRAQSILKDFFPSNYFTKSCSSNVPIQLEFLHQHPLTDHSENKRNKIVSTDVMLAVMSSSSPFLHYMSIFEYGFDTDKLAQLIVYCSKMVAFSQFPLPPILCCEYIMSQNENHGKLIKLHFFVAFIRDCKVHHITVCRVEKEEELEMSLAKIISCMVNTIPFYLKHIGQFRYWDTRGDNVAIGLSFDDNKDKPEKKVFKFYDYRGADENRFRRSPKGYPSKHFPGLEVNEICKDLCVLTYDFIEGTHKPQTVSHFLQIAKQLIELHNLNKVHGDVRLVNMLFTSEKDKNAVLLDYDYTESETYPIGYAMQLEDTERHPEINPGKQGGFKKKKKHDFYSFGKVCSFFKITSDSTGSKDDKPVLRSTSKQSECQKMWEEALELFCEHKVEKAVKILEKIADAKLFAISEYIAKLIELDDNPEGTGSPPRRLEKN